MHRVVSSRRSRFLARSRVRRRRRRRGRRVGAAHEKFAQESERVRRSRRVEFHHSLVQRFRDGGFQVRLGRVRGARVLLRGRSRLVVCRFKRRFRAGVNHSCRSLRRARVVARRVVALRVVVLAHLRSSSSRRRARRTSRRRLTPSRSGARVIASSPSFATRARARGRGLERRRARAR